MNHAASFPLSARGAGPEVDTARGVKAQRFLCEDDWPRRREFPAQTGVALTRQQKLTPELNDAIWLFAIAIRASVDGALEPYSSRCDFPTPKIHDHQLQFKRNARKDLTSEQSLPQSHSLRNANVCACELLEQFRANRPECLH